MDQCWISSFGLSRWLPGRLKGLATLARSPRFIFFTPLQGEISSSARYFGVSFFQVLESTPNIISKKDVNRGRKFGEARIGKLGIERGIALDHESRLVSVALDEGQWIVWQVENRPQKFSNRLDALFCCFPALLSRSRRLYAVP